MDKPAGSMQQNVSTVTQLQGVQSARSSKSAGTLTEHARSGMERRQKQPNKIKQEKPKQ